MASERKLIYRGPVVLFISGSMSMIYRAIERLNLSLYYLLVGQPYISLSSQSPLIFVFEKQEAHHRWGTALAAKGKKQLKRCKVPFKKLNHFHEPTCDVAIQPMSSY